MSVSQNIDVYDTNQYIAYIKTEWVEIYAWGI